MFSSDYLNASVFSVFIVKWITAVFEHRNNGI